MTSAIGLLTTLDGSVRHRAFLSYSHRDEEACIRLHADLENYEVPKELVGKKGAHGPIPAHLRPIFRDRSDLEAGDTVDLGRPRG